MTTEQRREQYRAAYYKNLESNRAKAREREAKKRANRNEAPEEADARRAYHRDYYRNKLSGEYASARKEKADAENAETLAVIPTTEPQRTLWLNILIATLAAKHQAQVDYRREWKRKRYGHEPRKPAAPKPVKAKRVLQTQEEKRAGYRKLRKRYMSIPENREKVNESKRLSSVKLLEEAKGDVEALKALRAKRRASNMGWLDRMRRDNPADYEAYKKKMSEKERVRRSTNPQRRFACALRTKVYTAIRRQQNGLKTFSTEELTGCTVAELMKIIESRWKEGMNWDNFGKGANKWTLDHTQPCASVDLTNPEQQKKIFHHSNLQPMWYFENCSKGSNHEGRRWKHSDHACIPPPPA